PRGPARFSATAPDVEKQGDAAPIQGRGSLPRLRKGAGRRTRDTRLFLSFSTVLSSCLQEERDRKRSRRLSPASNRNPILGVSSERPPHRSHPECSRKDIEPRRAKCSSNRHKQRSQRKQSQLPM